MDICGENHGLECIKCSMGPCENRKSTIKISTAVTVTFEFEENYPGTLEQAEEGTGFKVGSSEHKQKIKKVITEILNDEFNTGVTTVKKCMIDKFISAASN